MLIYYHKLFILQAADYYDFIIFPHIIYSQQDLVLHQCFSTLMFVNILYINMHKEQKYSSQSIYSLQPFSAASPLAWAIYHQFSQEKYPDSAWYVCDVCACVMVKILQVLNAYIQSAIKISFLSFAMASATSDIFHY